MAFFAANSDVAFGQELAFRTFLQGLLAPQNLRPLRDRHFGRQCGDRRPILLAESTGEPTGVRGLCDGMYRHLRPDLLLRNRAVRAGVQQRLLGWRCPDLPERTAGDSELRRSRRCPGAGDCAKRGTNDRAGRRRPEFGLRHQPDADLGLHQRGRFRGIEHDLQPRRQRRGPKQHLNGLRRHGRLDRRSPVQLHPQRPCRQPGNHLPQRRRLNRRRLLRHEFGRWLLDHGSVVVQRERTRHQPGCNRLQCERRRRHQRDDHHHRSGRQFPDDDARDGYRCQRQSAKHVYADQHRKRTKHAVRRHNDNQRLQRRQGGRGHVRL